MGHVEPAAPPRQRWRVTFRRLTGAPRLGHQEWAAAWEAAAIRTGLPLAMQERGTAGRPRLQLGPPLAAGMPAERELLDLFLAEQRPIIAVRSALVDALPAGIELIDLHDVWVGEPAIQAQVVAVVYRIEAELPAGLTTAGVEAACRALLASGSLPRRRLRGAVEVGYDLRPLIDDLVVSPDVRVISGGDASTLLVHARLRVDPERGTGRPEEVVAALEERIGAELAVLATVRERVIVAADDLTEPTRA